MRCVNHSRTAAEGSFEWTKGETSAFRCASGCKAFRPWHVAGPMNPPSLKLVVLPEILAVSRLEASGPIPDWAKGEGFLSISRTRDELSVICEERFVPEGAHASKGWRAFKIVGPLDLDLVGILVSVAVPLAQSGVGILPIATYETDYVLVRDEQLAESVKALRFAGFDVVVES